MSVLNQSGEEQVECPLCMEPLEVDDLNFFPCTCGYQICRFCWHRIRTDENGLCPACRKAYSENPADFIPLSKEQVAKLKAEKRQKDQQRKAKQSESRKHLASVRVVQRNLVFVVGLPMRLADPEILKRHEYFGKFGKIHKVVINQSTSYAGSQGPSASAYVTYMKSDDALRAIQSVNNITIDGRLIKSSLGTTKYCSHFLKNQTCPKPDCMYLHDYGDPEASFTKEEMHASKHQEYEKKLHENLLMRTANNNNHPTLESKNSVPIPSSNSTTGSCSPKENTSFSSSCSSTDTNSSGTNKENWPNLNNTEKEKKDKDKTKKGKTKNGESSGKRERKESHSGSSKSEGRSDNCSCSSTDKDKSSPPFQDLQEQAYNSHTDSQLYQLHKLPSRVDDNTSFFSLNSFQKLTSSHREEHNDTENETTQTSLLTDTLPAVDTSEDWAAAFGFRQTQITDDLGIESTNGLYLSSKDHILEIGGTKRKNGFTGYGPEPVSPKPTVHNGLNGLDQTMSKFFMDFHKNNKKLNSNGQELHNGLNGIHHNYYSGFQTNSDRIVLLQQKQLEDHLLKLSLKQSFGNGSNSVHSNSANIPPYMNGDDRNYGNLQGHSYEHVNMKQNIRNTEDDLGFDPFQETQKAFAELMASEQNHKIHNTGPSQLNGIIHNNGGHLPPPPPGFVQSNTHMNSFGSKILPFLNMSNNQQQQQQQQINNATQNNWPSIFNPQLQQPPPQPPQPKHQKSPTNTDWKVLDPAILSSSRHFPLANMSPIRDHYSNLTQIGTQQIQNGPPPSLRPYEFTNNTFSNFSHQLQPNFNNFTLINPQQNLSWFGNDPNSQISSPPGFLNNQATKQQEC